MVVHGLELAVRLEMLAATRADSEDVKDIVSEVLEAAGIPTSEQRWQLAGSYDKRDYCLQYFESTLAFVSRLCEEEGIFFSTIVVDGGEVLVDAARA